MTEGLASRSFPQPRGEQLRRVLRKGAEAEHLHPRRGRPNLRNALLNPVAQVGLGQQHDRHGAALPGDGEVPFQPAQVEIPVQRHAHEQRVQVGRDDLLALASGHAAHEQTVPGQYALDDRAVVPQIGLHEVAHDG